MGNYSSFFYIFPFFPFSDDYNRVVLEMEEGVPDSDYINASYVDVSKIQIDLNNLVKSILKIAQ